MATDQSPQQKRTWPKWVGLVIALLLVLYALLGFLVLPWWLKQELPVQAREYLGWQAESGDVSANPFTLSVTVRDFSATDSGGEPVARAAEAHLNVSFLQLFLAQIGIDNFRLEQPYLRLEIGPEGNLNVLQDWRNNNPNPPASEGRDSGSGKSSGSDPGFPLVIEDARLVGGKILLRDRRGGETQEFNISPLQFDLSGVATFENAGDAGRYYLSATLGDNQNLTWQGDISLMPLKSNGEIALENLSADALWHFLGRYTPYDWRQGRISVRSNYQVNGTEPLQFELNNGQVGIEDSVLFLSPEAEGQPALKVSQLNAKGLSYTLAQSQLRIETISAEGWELLLSRSEQGAINWVSASGESGDKEGDDSSSASGDGEGAFSWRIGRVALDSGIVQWRDQALARPADIRLDRVNLELTDLTGDPDSPVGLNLSLSGSADGQGQLNGEFTLNPFTLESAVQITDFTLTPFQPYLNDAVNLELTNGTLGFDGNVSLDDQEPELTGSVEGTLSADTVKTQLVKLDAPFLSWKSLRLSPLRVQLKPLTVEIPKVSWVEPAFTYVRTPDGDNSVARLTADKSAKENSGEDSDAGSAGESSSGEGPVGFAMRIQQLDLQNASITLDDRAIEGGFKTRLHALNGQLTALGNQRPQRADIRLQGEVADQGNLSLDGTIGALGQNDTSELHLIGENIALPPFTPYVERYLGYVVESGRLALDLDYTVEGAQIDGSNDIVMEDFNLGERVNSPQAVDAPVRLGLALLRDRSGTIAVELPVNGSLSDPSFNFSEVILSTFSGLVARAATAPFSILGNLANLGRSEEDLGNIGFVPGSAQLPAKEQEELQALSEALAERPAVTLAYRGLSAPGWDGPALALADRGVSLPAGGLGPLVDALERQLVEAEGEATLENLVGARDDDAEPRRSSAEWAQTLLSRLTGEASPEPGALRALAENRASAIQQALVNSGMDTDRLTQEPVRTDAEFKNGYVNIPLAPDSR